MTESKECRLCHRIGYRDFLPAGGEDGIWECGNDLACRARQARRARGIYGTVRPNGSVR